MKRVGVTIAATTLAAEIDAPEWAATVWPIKRHRSIKLIVRVHPWYPLDKLKIPGMFMGYPTTVEEDQPAQAGYNACQMAASHLTFVHVTTQCAATASVSGAAGPIRMTDQRIRALRHPKRS